ncbi:hypothetical protein ACFXEL_36460 [Streptomyces sp. NPDC059382]|uniref:hypothetical protein n=1 Tax=Streptomyces sp. NPDC059382 TaxID=3346816 RepID=UPI00368C0DA6
MVGKALWVGGRILLAAVAVAAAYGSSWAVWAGSGGWSAVLILVCAVVAQWAGVAWLARRGAMIAVVALLVMNVAWLALTWIRTDMREEQTLHDRGVTTRAVVTGWIHTSDPLGGVDDAVTAIDVRLPDDGGVRRLQLMGAGAPDVGESVEVTRDPGGRVPIRLGPRPDAPGGVPATIALIVLIGSSLVCSVAAFAALS